jgi:hypothetical protein
VDDVTAMEWQSGEAVERRTRKDHQDKKAVHRKRKKDKKIKEIQKNLY